MLVITAYPREYIERCRTIIDRQIELFREIVDSREADERAAVEEEFASNTVLLIEQLFVHRSTEGDDGGPLAEVRALASSIRDHGGSFHDESGTVDPESSVSGLNSGDRLRLDLDAVERLSHSFFDEIERRASVA